MGYGRRLIMLSLLAASLGAAEPPAAKALDMHGWRIIPERSGDVDYYRVLDEDGRPFIRGAYRPPYKTAVLGYALPDGEHERVRTLRWAWRAIKLPEGGDECAEHKGDSAAVVYVTWKRRHHHYTIKYVWSGVGQKGAVCDRKRKPFVKQDTVILESGAPLGVWREAAIDLDSEWRRHFGDGDPRAEVPPFLGVGIMTDGDQTRSESVADFRDFRIEP